MTTTAETLTDEVDGTVMATVLASFAHERTGIEAADQRHTAINARKGNTSTRP